MADPAFINSSSCFACKLQYRIAAITLIRQINPMANNYKLKRLNASRDYIANNYHARLNLAEIAKQSSMSPYHFLRVFKDTYGETPNEFLIRLRVVQAKKMLIAENFSVSDICEKVGYASLGSFSSLFLKHVGMAPTSYRRKLWALSAEPYRFPLQAIPACYAYYFLGKKRSEQ